MAQTSGNRAALDNLVPSGNLAVGPRETGQQSECAWGLTPWEAVDYVMFWPAHGQPGSWTGLRKPQGEVVSS